MAKHFSFSRLLPAILIAVGSVLQLSCSSTAQESSSGPSVASRPSSPAASSFDAGFALPLKLPGATRTPTLNAAAKKRAAEIREKNAKYPTYKAWRELASLYETNYQYENAAEALRAGAEMYRKQGLVDAALIEENKAVNLETQIGFYYDRPASDKEIDTLYTGARLEPIIGCYRGAFIDRDDQVGGKYFDENWQEHRSIPHFEELTGHKHATYFMYVAYGQKFPRKWIEECKKADAIPQIAWEPRDLKAVRDDAYLQSWAKALREVDWPVFIRFAGEMNGFWTPYHGNAKLYRDKFTLVHRALHKAAPKVATIWCVNSIPLQNIDNYYPGDDNCDWVGINIYSVPFSDNNRNRPAYKNTPLTLIDPIYQKYAARKPIAICEYAASHMAAVDKTRRNDLAIDKMAQLYTALPLLYPRIKLIDWFSMNTMKHAKPGRQLNNYSLTEQQAVLQAYRTIQTDPHFLGTREHLSETRPPWSAPLKGGQSVSDTLRLRLWIKTYVPRPKVYLRWDRKIVYGSKRPGAHLVNLDLKNGPTGRQELQVLVFDDANRFVASRSVTIEVQPARGPYLPIVSEECRVFGYA